MKKEEAFVEDSQSQINSSTSSYSEIIPRQQNLVQVRKDKPIIIRSIPITKPKQSIMINSNTEEQKRQSITLINSTHAHSNLSQSNISAEVYKNDIKNQKHLSSAKEIQNEEKLQEKQIIFNQNLVKSTYEKYHKNHQLSQNIDITAKKQQKGQKEEYDNVILDLSLSSMNSQKPPAISPKNPFKMYLDPSPEKSQNPASRKEQDIKIYLQAIKQMRREEQNKNTPIKSQSFQLQTLMKKNHELQTRIREYEELIKTETESMIMERKANEIYTEFYHTLSKMISKFLSANKGQFSFQNHDSSESLNESVNMEKILQTVDKLIEKFSFQQIHQIQKSITSKQVQTEVFSTEPPKLKPLKPIEYSSKIHQLEVLLYTAEQKNTQLRSELLQSTQNNINAIFNSQISASCCLENQVTKINSEMTFLKEKMNLLFLKNQPTVVNPPQSLPPQIIYLSQPSPTPSNPLNERKQNNIVKIYTTKCRGRESDDESESVEEHERNRRRHSLSRKGKRSSRSQRSQSSMSSKSTKKREELSMKEIQNLKQAYSQTKAQLNSLIQTFSLITNSQNQMKGYFSHIKDEIIKSMNEKIKQQEEENNKKYEESKRKEEENKRRQIEEQKRQIEAKKSINQQISQHQARLNLELRQKIKQKQESYINQMQSIKQQRQHDRNVIFNLNQKVIELLNAISVPQKVNQQHKKSETLYDDEIPLSQISVSVDYLKLIEQLKTEKQKQLIQIEALMKQNSFLKDQIVQLKNIEQRSRVIQKLQDSPSSSNEGQQSIINGLNGFTEICIPAPPLMLNTGSNYQISNNVKSTKTLQSNKHVTFNSNVSSNKFIPSMQKIESQKLVKVRTDSQKNLENNFKVILQSKQNHIKSLQQEILNLQQTIEYLKGQIISKDLSIEELENYVSNLENRSLNSISVSSPQINIPQTNLYIDPLNTSEQIKHKYENYVKNLKILLKQTKNQNKRLKEQLLTFQTQIDQQTESNFNLKQSATHSERTTKNFPTSSSAHVHHAKTNAEIVVRKRVDNSERFENQRQEQRINSLAYENEIPEEMDKARTKSKFPAL